MNSDLNEIDITKTENKKEFTFTHMEDPKSEFDLGKAKKNCRHCLGRGLAGRMHLTGVRLVCRCVVKASFEAAQLLKKPEQAQAETKLEKPQEQKGA